MMAGERRVLVPRRFQAELDEESIRELSVAIEQAQKGQTNNYYNVELAANETETVVVVEYARPGGIANFSPSSQSVADAIAGGESIWTSVERGQFTVHHAAVATTGRTIGVTLAG